MVDPANPYLSCVVEASAGSGKTHQLSERFLSLVAAGSDPSKILTITFTVKAAGEMRTRIIEKAMALVFREDAAHTFSHRMESFYKERRSLGGNSFETPKPRTARETGEAILAATQALRVSTIDALFKEWVMKFPEEAGVQSDMALGDTLQVGKIKKLAWNQYLETDFCRALLKQTMLRQPTFSMSALFDKVETLNRYEGLIYLSKDHPLALWGAEPMSEETAVGLIAEDLAQIGEAYEKFRGPIEAAIAQNSLQSLREAQLISGKHKINGNQIKGKKRDLLQTEIKHIEDVLQSFRLRQVLFDADREGEIVFQIWQGYQRKLKDIKTKKRILEFSDLTQGVHRLFHGETTSGVSWLIQQGLDHLLIDEFQDTSRLQWEVFRAIALELLAGPRGSKSVFFVGDRKQSIYGFREADPSVLDEAKDMMEQQGAFLIEMSKSYRSSPFLLEGVNSLLENQMADFPRHEAARSKATPDFPDGKLLTPNEGGVWRLPSTKETEVEEVASLIQRLIQEGEKFPVCLKSKKVRALRAEDIAVLYRDKSKSDDLELALRKLGNSSVREEKQGYFLRSEIHDLKHLLQWLCYSYDEYALLVFLSGPIGGFSGDDYQAIISSQSPSRVEEHLARRNPDLYQALKATKSEVDRLPLEILLMGLWRRLAIPHVYRQAFGGTEGDLAARNLESLLLMAADRKGRLQDFVPWMEESTRADDQGNTSFSGGGAVRMMTIHKAKGLEFPLVIVMGMGRELTRDDSYWSKKDPFKISFLPLKRDLPEDFGYEEILPYQVQANGEEVKRLVYVAATRASQYLILSSGQSKPTKEESHPKDSSQTFYDLATFDEITEETWGFQLGEIESATLEKPITEKITHENTELENGNLFGEILKADLNSVEQPFSSFNFNSESSLFPREITLVSPSGSSPRSTSGSEKESEIRGGDFSDLKKNRSGISESSFQKQFQESLGDVRSREESARAGVFFHRCLELGFREGSLQKLEDIWFSILGDEESQLKEEYFEMVIRSFNSSKLSHLVSKAERKRTEAPYGFLSGQDLVRGSMDLVLEFKDEVMVIDYKTSNVIADHVGNHALTHGYVNQIRHYMDALKVIYSEKKILGGLWYARPGLLWEIQNDT